MASAGEYQAGRTLGAAGPVVVREARPTGTAGPYRLAIKSFEIDEPLFWLADADAEVARQRFVAAITRHRSLGPIGGVASVRGSDVSGSAPFIVTDRYPLTGRDLIGRRANLSHDALLHVVRSVVQTLQAIGAAGEPRARASGSTHGNLKLSNLLFAGRGSLARRTVVLTDPCPDPADRDARAELADVGRLIESFVNARDAFSSDDFALMRNERWDRLGPQAERWLAICESLRDPEAPDLRTLDDLHRALRAFGSRRGRMIRRGVVATAAAAVLGAGGWTYRLHEQFVEAERSIADFVRDHPDATYNAQYVEILAAIKAGATPLRPSPATPVEELDPYSRIHLLMGDRVRNVVPEWAAAPTQPSGVDRRFLADYRSVLATAEALRLLDPAHAWQPARGLNERAKQGWLAGKLALNQLDNLAKNPPTPAQIENLKRWQRAIDAIDAISRAPNAKPPGGLDQIDWEGDVPVQIERIAAAEADRLAGEMAIGPTQRAAWREQVARMTLLPEDVRVRLTASIEAGGNDFATLTAVRDGVSDLGRAYVRLLAAATVAAPDEQFGPQLQDAARVELARGRPDLNGDPGAVLQALALRVKTVADDPHWAEAKPLLDAFGRIATPMRAQAIKEAEMKGAVSEGLAALAARRTVFDDYAPATEAHDAARAAAARLADDLRSAGAGALDADTLGAVDAARRRVEAAAALDAIERNRDAFVDAARQADDARTRVREAIASSQRLRAAENEKLMNEQQRAEQQRADAARGQAALAERNRRIEAFDEAYRTGDAADAVPVALDALRAADPARFDDALRQYEAFFQTIRALPRDLEVDPGPFASLFAQERAAWIAEHAKTLSDAGTIKAQFNDGFRKGWTDQLRDYQRARHTIESACADGRDLGDPIADAAAETLASSYARMRALPIGSRGGRADASIAAIDLLNALPNDAPAHLATAVDDPGRRAVASQAARAAFVKLLADPAGSDTLLAADGKASAPALLATTAGTPFGRKRTQALFDGLTSKVAATNDAQQWARLGAVAEAAVSLNVTLSPAAEYNVSLARARLAVGQPAGGNDGVATEAVRRLAETVKRLADAPPALAKQLEGLRASDAALPPGVTLAADGSEATLDAPGMVLKFRRVATTGRFVSTTEVPAAVLKTLFVLKDGKNKPDWYTPFGLLTSDEMAAKTKGCPAVWFIGRGGPPTFDRRDYPWNYAKQKYHMDSRIPVTAASAGERNPMNFVSADTAIKIAAEFKMSLPTAKDWDELQRIALARKGKDWQDCNMRDQQWNRRQQALKAFTGGGAVQFNENSYDTSPVVVDAAFYDDDDGALFFWDVEKGMDAAGFKNIFGNVAEYVMTAAGEIAVVGGSALSSKPPTSDGVPPPATTNRISILHSNDVGFRFAFSASAAVSREDLAKRLEAIAFLPIPAPAR